MQELATQAWNPWVAWLVLGVGAVLLLVTLGIPARGLPKAVAALRERTVTADGGGPLWLALAAATGMGGITGGVLAIRWGGPGALVWMWLATLAGMALAFAEGSLGARARNDDEPASVHLLAAPKVGRLLAPMYTLAIVVMALVVGATFQAHEAGAVLESTLGIPARTVAIGLAVVAAPFILVPRLRRPLFVLVPLAMLLYVAASASVLAQDTLTLGLLVGEAFNQAFGLTPAAAGAAGGGVGLAITHGVLRATMAGEAGLGSAALLDLRARSRGAAGAVAMVVPLLASGVIGSLSALLILTGPAFDEPVTETELVPLERAQARGLRPSQQVGQTIVLPADTPMEAEKHYAMRLRSNPRGHAMAKLVTPEQQQAAAAAQDPDAAVDPTLKSHVALPHWGIAANADTLVLRGRDADRAALPSWDVRIPCSREVKTTRSGLEYLLLRPIDPEIDIRKLAIQLDLSTQPYVVFDDFDFVGTVGRATHPKLGEHLAMFEAQAADRALNPKLHEFFRMGYRGPYSADDGPRPPFAFVASAGFEPDIGSIVDLRIEGDPRGDAVVGLTRSGTLEAPAWDLLLDSHTIVLRHADDPALDIRIEVQPKVQRHRIRFDILDHEAYRRHFGEAGVDFDDAQLDDFRIVDTMKAYTGPYLVVPPYDFRAEVHGDTRLDPEFAGRRSLVPLHAMGEAQGAHGDGETYRPHPGDLIAMGMRGPVVRQQGAQLVAARVTAGMGRFGRLAIVIAVFVFALTTLVGWSELGARAASAIAGSLGGPVLRLAMLAAAALGATWTLTELLPLVDLTIAAVAVPNLLGLLLLIPRIRSASAGSNDLGTDE